MPRGRKTTAAQLKKFLASLEQEPNVAEACRVAGIGIQTVYDWRERDPEFAHAWDECLEVGMATLEGSVYRRATQGVFVGYQASRRGGLIIDPETGGPIKLYKPSDTLTVLLLKAYRPDVYGAPSGKTTKQALSNRIEIVYADSEQEKAEHNSLSR